MARSSSRTRRLAVVLGVNVALAAAQVVAGLLAHSTGLLADAGHNVTDAAGISGSLIAVQWASRPRSPAHSFGYHRGTILAALANAAIIAAVTGAIIVVGVERLLRPSSVQGGIVIGTALGAFAVNAVAARLLHDDGGELNMRSAALHMTADAAASLVVAAAGAVILADPHLRRADPIASLAVGLLIIIEAYRLLRASLDVLLESSPADVDLAELTGAMGTVPGVAEVHDLHVWSLSSEVRALSAHIVVVGHPSLEEAQAIGDRVKEAVAGPFTIAHSTLELECERCSEDVSDPCLMDALAPPPVPARR
ncbi:MAG: cation diffusion facilitator family transporter [Acidimicrobiales bacterium]